METTAAVDRLQALAHPTRLDLFRRLVQRGPEGVPAGELAEALGVPKPTLSFHLAALQGAGLVRSERRGRSIRYAADFLAMGELVGFLYENCCGGGGARCGLPVRPNAAEPRAGRRTLRARSPK